MKYLKKGFVVLALGGVTVAAPLGLASSASADTASIPPLIT